jgi:hypothetical protein
MGGARSRDGRDERRIKYWPENLKGRDHSEEVGAVGMIILEWILQK